MSIKKIPISQKKGHNKRPKHKRDIAQEPKNKIFTRTPQKKARILLRQEQKKSGVNRKNLFLLHKTDI